MCGTFHGRVDAGDRNPAEWKQRAISSAVERLPYKQDVAGSNPASRISSSHCPAGVCGLQQLGSAPYGLPTPSAQIRLNFLTDRVGASGSSWLKGLSRQFKRHRQGRPGWFIEEHRDRLRLRSDELPQGPGETGSASLKPSPSPPLQALLRHPQPWLKPARSSIRSVRSHGRGRILRPRQVPKIQPT